MNNVSEHISIFTGCNHPYIFDGKFSVQKDNELTQILISKKDTDKYIKKINTFSLVNPSELQNIKLNIELENIKDVYPNLKDKNEVYIKHMKNYITEWNKLCKECKSIKEKICKTQKDFKAKIEYIIKLDVNNLSHLYVEICKRTEDNWSNVIHFLSLLEENNPNKKIIQYFT